MAVIMASFCQQTISFDNRRGKPKIIKLFGNHFSLLQTQIVIDPVIKYSWIFKEWKHFHSY